MYPPFTPNLPTVTIAVTNASGNAQLTGSGQRTLMVTSVAGGSEAFIRFAATSALAVALTTDTPILPGTVQMFSIGDLDVFVAAITGAGTATLRFTSGQGQ